MKKEKSSKSELLILANVGPATLQDLYVLGIYSIADLASQNPDELYERLQELTGKKHDPCVWDVFAAIIHEAQTGQKLPWWHWSGIRKNRKKQ